MKIKGSGKIVGAFALAAVITLTGGGVVVAQQPQPQPQPQPSPQGDAQRRAERPRGREGRRGGVSRSSFGPFLRMAKQLNLSEAQLERMRQIEERHLAALESRRERKSGDEEHHRLDLFAGGSFDESAVRAEAQARANAQVEREVAQARMLHEMYNVLTAEQKAQFQTFRRQREERDRELRTRPGQRQGQLRLR